MQTYGAVQQLRNAGDGEWIGLMTCVTERYERGGGYDSVMEYFYFQRKSRFETNQVINMLSYNILIQNSTN